jgi:hypothetical protein
MKKAIIHDIPTEYDNEDYGVCGCRENRAWYSISIPIDEEYQDFCKENNFSLGKDYDYRNVLGVSRAEIEKGYFESSACEDCCKKAIEMGMAISEASCFHMLIATFVEIPEEDKWSKEIYESIYCFRENHNEVLLLVKVENEEKFSKALKKMGALKIEIEEVLSCKQ